jgi:hypothetical protein
VPHATTLVDNSDQATISRGKEWLRDIKPPQESLIAFLNEIQATFFSGPSNIAGPGKLSIIFLFAEASVSGVSGVSGYLGSDITMITILVRQA